MTAASSGAGVASNRRWLVLALLGTAFFMTILDGTGLLTALPSIEGSLHLTGSSVQWAVTIYALAFSGPLLFSGRLADLLGRRRMFLTGMVLRVASSLLCGFAPTGDVLVLARAAQGLSAAVIAPAALSMVMNAFPDGAERNKALGVWGSLGGFGATAGLLFGGLITQAWGWQWVFWINVPIGVVVLILAPGLLKESHRRDRSRSFDVAGALTVTAALVLLVLTITQVPTAGWAAVSTWLPLLGVLVLLGLFAFVERRSADPLIPPRLLKLPTLVKGNLLVLIAGMSVDGMLVTLTGYVQQVLGWSALRFGLVGMVMTLTAVVGGMTAQKLVTKIGGKPVAITGTILLTGSCLLLTRISANGSPAVVFIGLFAFGAGMGAAAVASQITALTAIPERDSGVGAGLADTSFALGTALGVAICTSAAAAAANGTAAAARVSGDRLSFAVAACFGLAGLVIALTLPRKPRQPTSEPTGSKQHEAVPAD